MAKINITTEELADIVRTLGKVMEPLEELKHLYQLEKLDNLHPITCALQNIDGEVENLRHLERTVDALENMKDSLSELCSNTYDLKENLVRINDTLNGLDSKMFEMKQRMPDFSVVEKIQNDFLNSLSETEVTHESK